MTAEIGPGLVWLAAGLAMAAAEVLAPGFFLIWLGLAAIGTGTAEQALGIGLTGQCLLFAALAAALCLAGRRVRRKPDRADVNSACSGLVGRTATVLASHDAQSRVRLGDSDWAARPADRAPMPPQGAAVEVVAVEGVTLVVRPWPM